MIIEIYNEQLSVGSYKIILTDTLTGKEFTHIVELYSGLELTLTFDFNVVIANGLNFLDALMGLALASTLNAPVFVANSTAIADSLSVSRISAAKGMLIFLSFKDHMPEKTMNAIKKIKPFKIYVFGGNDLITDTMVNDLKK